jgi:hypothetical protein
MAAVTCGIFFRTERHKSGGQSGDFQVMWLNIGFVKQPSIQHSSEQDLYAD